VDVDGGGTGPPPLLVEGVRLFNAGRWFEAHEVLEDAWRAEPGEVRHLYQGLLQVGVGLLHASRGNLRGALSVLDRGIARLEPFRPCRLGLDVDGLLRDAAATRRALAEPGGLEAFRPSEAPKASLSDRSDGALA
jgi:predicted metal-dependent hydrolase